jgi:hypothetical protein
MARPALFVLVVIGGGLLQSDYTHARHPSLILRIWAVLYGALFVWIVFQFVAGGVRAVRDKRTANRFDTNSES